MPRFSRTRSNTTIVSIIEYDITVRIAATIVRFRRNGSISSHSPMCVPASQCEMPIAPTTISVSCNIATTVAVPYFRLPNRSQMYAMMMMTDSTSAISASRWASPATWASKLLTF